MWHFIFVDQSHGQDADQAAQILADGLSQQGCPHTLQTEWVLAEGPGQEEHWLYLLFDPSLIDSPILRASMQVQSLVLVCSAEPAPALEAHLPIEVKEVATVDAQRIAISEGADPTSALLGGLARLAPWVDAKALQSALWAHHERAHGYGAGAAIRAFNRGYRQLEAAPRSARPLP